MRDNAVLMAAILLAGCITGEPAPSLAERFPEAVPEGWSLAFHKDSGVQPYGWFGYGGCSYFRLENKDMAYSEAWFCPPGWSAHKDDTVPWPISAEKIMGTAEYDIYYYSIIENPAFRQNLNATFT